MLISLRRVKGSRFDAVSTWECHTIHVKILLSHVRQQDLQLVKGPLHTGFKALFRMRASSWYPQLKMWIVLKGDLPYLLQ